MTTTEKILELAEEALFPYQAMIREDGPVSFGNDIDRTYQHGKPHFRGDFYAPIADAKYIETVANHAVPMAELLVEMAHYIARSQLVSNTPSDYANELLKKYNTFQSRVK